MREIIKAKWMNFIDTIGDGTYPKILADHENTRIFYNHNITISLCQPVNYIMKTCEWTPTRRSRTLALTEEGRCKLREISQITNIPIDALGDLKKRGMPLTRPRSDRPHKLSERHKRRIEFHVTRNHAYHHLSMQ